MLGFIYELMIGFEQEHGVQPNTLYLNKAHSEHLLAAFEHTYSVREITRLLQMEMIIDAEVMHPRVAWTQAAHRIAS